MTTALAVALLRLIIPSGLCFYCRVCVSIMRQVLLLWVVVAGALATEQHFDLNDIFGRLRANMREKSKLWVESRSVDHALERRDMVMLEALALAAFAPHTHSVAMAAEGAHTAEGHAAASPVMQDMMDVHEPVRSLEDICDNIYNLKELIKIYNTSKKDAEDHWEDFQSGHWKFELPIRKDYRCMSDKERKSFHAAVHKLKHTICKNDSKSIFDKFITAHNYEDAPGAHLGPAFLPWHRILLLIYQGLLYLADPNVVLPYWDSSHEIAIADPLKSIVWTETYMGNADLQVTTGPFANWVTNGTTYPTLWRNVTGDLSDVYNDTRFAIIQSIPDFLNTSIAQEGFHNLPHDYISGDMGQIPTAARDPVFFLHHAFVDCVWEEWREAVQYPKNDSTEETDYPSNDQVDEVVWQNMLKRNKTAPKHHYYNATGLPFASKIKDGLLRMYTEIYYTCQPHGTCPNNACGADGYGGDHCLTTATSGGAALAPLYLMFLLFHSFSLC